MDRSSTCSMLLMPETGSAGSTDATARRRAFEKASGCPWGRPTSGREGGPGVPKGFRESQWLSVGAHNQRRERHRELAEGRVHLRLGFKLQTRMAHSLYHAYNLTPNRSAAQGLVEADSFAQRRIVRPVPLRHDVADDDNVRSVGGIGCAQRAAGK